MMFKKRERQFILEQNEMQSDNRQMTIFDFLPIDNQEQDLKILKVGDKVGRVVKGEAIIGTIYKVEGKGKGTFYRTDQACFSYKEGLRSIEELKKEAEEKRKKYKTIIPEKLEKRITFLFKSQDPDKPLWGQIGIFKGMLYWKDCCTYEFLEIYESEKKLMKAYENHKKDMYDRCIGTVDEEHEMERLYFIQSKNMYASPQYLWYG